MGLRTASARRPLVAAPMAPNRPINGRPACNALDNLTLTTELTDIAMDEQSQDAVDLFTDDILQVIKSMESSNGPELLFNDDDIEENGELKEARMRDLAEEVSKRQIRIEKRLEALMKHARTLQAKGISLHFSQEVAGVFEMGHKAMKKKRLDSGKAAYKKIKELNSFEREYKKSNIFRQFSPAFPGRSLLMKPPKQIKPQLSSPEPSKPSNKENQVVSGNGARCLGFNATPTAQLFDTGRMSIFANRYNRNLKNLAKTEDSNFEGNARRNFAKAENATRKENSNLSDAKYAQRAEEIQGYSNCMDSEEGSHGVSCSERTFMNLKGSAYSNSEGVSNSMNSEGFFSSRGMTLKGSSYITSEAIPYSTLAGNSASNSMNLKAITYSTYISSEGISDSNSMNLKGTSCYPCISSEGTSNSVNPRSTYLSSVSRGTNLKGTSCSTCINSEETSESTGTNSTYISLEGTSGSNTMTSKGASSLDYMNSEGICDSNLEEISGSNSKVNSRSDCANAYFNSERLVPEVTGPDSSDEDDDFGQPTNKTTNQENSDAKSSLINTANHAINANVSQNAIILNRTGGAKRPILGCLSLKNVKKASEANLYAEELANKKQQVQRNNNEEVYNRTGVLKCDATNIAIDTDVSKRANNLSGNIDRLNSKKINTNFQNKGGSVNPEGTKEGLASMARNGEEIVGWTREKEEENVGSIVGRAERSEGNASRKSEESVSLMKQSKGESVGLLVRKAEGSVSPATRKMKGNIVSMARNTEENIGSTARKTKGSNVGSATTRKPEGNMGSTIRKMEENMGLMTRKTEGNIGLTTRKTEGNMDSTIRKTEGNVDSATRKTEGNMGLTTTKKTEGNMGPTTKKIEGNIGSTTRKSEESVGPITRKLEESVGPITRKLEGNFFTEKIINKSENSEAPTTKTILETCAASGTRKPAASAAPKTRRMEENSKSQHAHSREENPIPEMEENTKLQHAEAISKSAPLEFKCGVSKMKIPKKDSPREEISVVKIKHRINVNPPNEKARLNTATTRLPSERLPNPEGTNIINPEGAIKSSSQRSSNPEKTGANSEETGLRKSSNLEGVKLRSEQTPNSERMGAGMIPKNSSNPEDARWSSEKSSNPEDARGSSEKNPNPEGVKLSSEKTKNLDKTGVRTNSIPEGVKICQDKTNLERTGVGNIPETSSNPEEVRINSGKSAILQGVRFSSGKTSNPERTGIKLRSDKTSNLERTGAGMIAEKSSKTEDVKMSSNPELSSEKNSNLRRTGVKISSEKNSYPEGLKLSSEKTSNSERTSSVKISNSERAKLIIERSSNVEKARFATEKFSNPEGEILDSEKIRDGKKMSSEKITSSDPPMKNAQKTILKNTGINTKQNLISVEDEILKDPEGMKNVEGVRIKAENPLVSSTKAAFLDAKSNLRNKQETRWKDPVLNLRRSNVERARLHFENVLRTNLKESEMGKGENLGKSANLKGFEMGKSENLGKRANLKGFEMGKSENLENLEAARNQQAAAPNVKSKTESGKLLCEEKMRQKKIEVSADSILKSGVSSVTGSSNLESRLISNKDYEKTTKVISSLEDAEVKVAKNAISKRENKEACNLETPNGGVISNTEMNPEQEIELISDLEDAEEEAISTKRENEVVPDLRDTERLISIQKLGKEKVNTTGFQLSEVEAENFNMDFEAENPGVNSEKSESPISEKCSDGRNMMECPSFNSRKKRSKTMAEEYEEMWSSRLEKKAVFENKDNSFSVLQDVTNNSNSGEFLCRDVQKREIQDSSLVNEPAVQIIDNKKPVLGSSVRNLCKKFRIAMAMQGDNVYRHRHTTPGRYFGSGSVLVATAPRGSSAVTLGHLQMDDKKELQRTAGHLMIQSKMVQAELDSEATASSSGGESGDEMQPYNNPHQQYLPIYKRAAWKYATERAAIVARWTWLQAQISSLEYRIREHGEIHKRLRSSKQKIRLGGTSPAPASSPNTNGYKNQEDNSKPSESTEEIQCSRTRPLINFKKRKLLSLNGLHMVSKKAARPANIRCTCSTPQNECALCTGRLDPVNPRDVSEYLSTKELLGLLDPSYHPVISFEADASSTLHMEAVMKTEDWQSRSLSRTNHKTIRFPKLERAAKIASLGQQRKKKYRLKDGNSLEKMKNRYRGKKHNRPDSSTDEDVGNEGSPMSSQFSRNISSCAKRIRADSYDIDNIIIPYSVAAATRVEKLQYKEILTPKWRIAEDDFTTLKNDSNCDEEFSEEAVLQRHNKCEQEEKKKFLNYTKASIGHSRSRSSRHAESSTGNTPGGMSPSSQLSESPATTPPPTPGNLIEEITMRKRAKSQSKPTNAALTAAVQAITERDLNNPPEPPDIQPYEKRTFPLSDETYERMLKSIPEDQKVKTNARSQDSFNLNSPATNSETESADSVFGDEDPNDPEWDLDRVKNKYRR